MHGTVDAILNKKSRQTNVSLHVAGLMGSDEFEIRYPYADKEGYIIFGKGIHTHLDEISKINDYLGSRINSRSALANLAIPSSMSSSFVLANVNLT